MRDLYSVLKSVAIVGVALGAAALVYYSTRDEPEVLLNDWNWFPLGRRGQETYFYGRREEAWRRKAELLYSLIIDI